MRKATDAAVYGETTVIVSTVARLRFDVSFGRGRDTADIRPKAAVVVTSNRKHLERYGVEPNRSVLFTVYHIRMFRMYSWLFMYFMNS